MPPWVRQGSNGKLKGKHARGKIGVNLNAAVTGAFQGKSKKTKSIFWGTISGTLAKGKNLSGTMNGVWAFTGKRENQGLEIGKVLYEGQFDGSLTGTCNRGCCKGTWKGTARLADQGSWSS